MFVHTVVVCECAVGNYADSVITSDCSLLGRSWRRLSLWVGKNRWQWKIRWSKSSGMSLMLVFFNKQYCCDLSCITYAYLVTTICWSDKCFYLSASPKEILHCVPSVKLRLQLSVQTKIKFMAELEFLWRTLEIGEKFPYGSNSSLSLSSGAEIW